MLGIVSLWLLAFAPSASAGMTVDGFFGGMPGTEGGQYSNPQDLTVNTGNGDIYIAEGNRVQRLSAAGDFELIWGKDVDASNGETGAQEFCTVAEECMQGADGTGKGEFFGASGLAIDQSDGSVYVYDRENFRIQKFDADGNFILMFGKEVNATTSGDVCTAASGDLCQAGTTGADAGQISYGGNSTVRPKIAVDATTGRVFAADPGNRRILEYQPDGAFLRAWGGGVDTGAEAFEICTAASGCQAGLEFSSQNGSFSFEQPAFLAAGPGSILYASDTADSHRVMRFDTSQSAAADLLLSPLSSPPLAPPSSAPQVTMGLAVDPVSGHVFVARVPETGEGIIQEFDPLLSLVDTHGVGMGFRGGVMIDIALDPGRERMLLAYLDSREEFTACDTPLCAGFFVLDEDGPSQPSVTVSAPTDVGIHSATFHGTVDPAGRANYLFEYSRDGTDWTPAGEPAGISAGSAVPVSQAVTGLEANADYRVRIRVTKITSAKTTLQATSPELTFQTGGTTPDVATFYPQARTDTTVRFAGQINPNNQPTSYYFEYGKSEAYGSKSTERTATGGLDRVVLEEVAGLDPDSEYHVRLVATSAEGTSFGEDVSFRTRPQIAAVDRAFEMVTPPFKVTRTLSEFGGRISLGTSANPGTPSLDGNVYRMKVSFFPLLQESRFPFDGDELVSRRTPSGWVTTSRLTLPLLPFVTGRSREIFQFAASGDLETEAWKLGSLHQPAPLLEPENGTGFLSQYTRRDGTGEKGWRGWLRDPDTELVEPNLDELEAFVDAALFNDDGTSMARWGRYRNLADDLSTPADEDPSDDQQLPGAVGGSTAYLQQGPPDGAVDLVNECTGTVAGGDATEILQINDNGTPFDFEQPGFGMEDDYLDAAPCEEGSVTSRRGAVVGGNNAYGSNDLESQVATAMSDDGRRVFFLSPDPTAAPQPATFNITWVDYCKQVDVTDFKGMTGERTNCPPQLFVRQYDADGNATVRWISQPQGIQGARHPDSIGSGVMFESASRDGRFVYFKTDAPLLPSDPNRGVPVQQRADGDSMDLYRYDLGADPEADPGDGTLLRVTGGPSGSADPSTNTRQHDGGSAARFTSDDGRRAYFVTRGVIPGADQTPPSGGTTAPGGTSDNEETRNLYLFDDTGAEPTWTFIAQLPYGDPSQGSTSGRNWAKCATSAKSTGMERFTTVHGCFRGTPSGRVATFLTRAQLTADDRDGANDIFVYDADEDSLTRISAPPAGTEPYQCATGSDSIPDTCNAQYGSEAKNRASPDTLRGWGGGRSFNIAEEADGAVSVFFQSRLPLLPADRNVNVVDVYQWREGELSLVSRGLPGGHHSYYAGNSIDGRDVFFQTSDRIDPREVDDSDLDIYDARVGGGFPYTPPEPPCNPVALACEGKAAAPPPVAHPSTTEARKAKRHKKRRCRGHKVRRHGKCVKRRKHHQKSRSGKKSSRNVRGAK